MMNLFPLVLLGVEDPGDQNPGVPDDHPARLEDKGAVHLLCGIDDRPGIFRRVGRRLPVIGDAETAAEIEIADRDPLFPESRISSFSRPRASIKGESLRHLRTDMAAHPFDLQMLQAGGPPVGRERSLNVDAEFVLLETRRDMGVGLRIDIRIDPEPDARPDTQGLSPGVDLLQFLIGFDIEHEDAGPRAKSISSSLLPTPE